MKPRVRIAPSPTGPFHLGNARSALFNYVFAKKNGGTFILRIEDTDIERSRAVYEEDIKKCLRWLGLGWDEFYRESDRFDIYEKYLRELFEARKIFWCYHTKDELAREKEEQMQNKSAPIHVCSFRDDPSPKKESIHAILRLKNDAESKIQFDDLIRGKIIFDPKLLGDFSVARSFESPLFHFAVTLDDALMRISHVIRGEDHISNTPKHILLFDALNNLGKDRFEIPIFAHLPLILGKDRSKMSKRHGLVSLNQYKEEGYLPETMINFLALLGWHPHKIQIPNSKFQNEDIFSLDYLIENFDLKDVQKGGAIFDIEKLNWMNGEYIRMMPTRELAEKLHDYLKPEWQNFLSTGQIANSQWLKIVELEQPRLTKLADIGSGVDYFFEEPYISRGEIPWKNQSAESLKECLKRVSESLSDIEPSGFLKPAIEAALKPITSELGTGEVLWPMRYVLSGKRASPGPFEIAEILGKEKVISRIARAIEVLKS